MPKYRKNSLEARIDHILPEFPSYDVIAHELMGDGDGGWCVNDSWKMGRGCDREEAIEHLKNRWEIFKLNYHPRARVKDLDNVGDEYGALLEVDCIAFGEVRNADQ